MNEGWQSLTIYIWPTLIFLSIPIFPKWTLLIAPLKYNTFSGESRNVLKLEIGFLHTAVTMPLKDLMHSVP